LETNETRPYALEQRSVMVYLDFEVTFRRVEGKGEVRPP
jgi:hypothetical protein